MDYTEMPMNDWPSWEILVTYHGYVALGDWQPTHVDPNKGPTYVIRTWDEVVYVRAVCEEDARWTVEFFGNFAGHNPIIRDVWLEGDPRPEPLASTFAPTHYNCTERTCFQYGYEDMCWSREDEVCLGSGETGEYLNGVCDVCWRYFDGEPLTIPAHYGPRGE